MDTFVLYTNKCLSNAKKPRDCSVLCLRPKSSLWSCPRCIFRRDVIRQSWQRWNETLSVLCFFRLFHSWLTALHLSAGSFHTTKLCSRLYSIEIEFYFNKMKKIRFLSHPLGGLGAMYALHVSLVEKPVVDFLFVTIEPFSLSLTVETLYTEICPSRRFSKGWVTLRLKFRLKGYLSRQYLWPLCRPGCAITLLLKGFT